MALAVAVLGFSSDARAACPRVATPAVSVRVADPGPRVSSTKSLSQINAMAGSHGLSRKGFRVLGLTEIQIASAVKVRYEQRPSGGATCVNVSKVEVRFGLQNHHVHVPREYRRGSCQFKVVMRHEMAHVDVNRRTVRKYAKILKNEMRSVLRRAGPTVAGSFVKGQNVQAALVQKVLDDVVARFLVERDKLHAVIDTPGGKYSAGGQCQGW